MYSLKCYFETTPFYFVATALLISVPVFSFAIRVCEMYQKLIFLILGLCQLFYKIEHLAAMKWMFGGLW